MKREDMKAKNKWGDLFDRCEFCAMPIISKGVSVRSLTRK